MESAFQALEFGDRLRLGSLKERSACVLDMEGDVPPERNIVFKAIRAFREATGWDGGVRIAVEKRVPMGGGLGGGSSDAASALVGLDRLAGTGLPRSELVRLAASLGSDVPFFLEGGAAYVSGRGESVEPLEVRLDYGIVLANPGFPSDTGRAFAALDARRASGSDGACAPLGRDAVAAALSRGAGDWPFRNDFLGALSACFPEDGQAYASILGALSREGAAFVGLTGSGSTCFGVFPDPGDAAKAEKRLSERFAFVKATRPLARAGNAVLE